MAVQIVVQRLVSCDRCGAPAPDEALPFLLPPARNHKPRSVELELCTACRSEFYDPVVELFRDKGRAIEVPVARAAHIVPPASAPKAAAEETPEGRVACPVPECVAVGRTVKNRTGLSVHCRTMHGMTLTEAEGRTPRRMKSVS